MERVGYCSFVLVFQEFKGMLTFQYSSFRMMSEQGVLHGPLQELSELYKLESIEETFEIMVPFGICVMIRPITFRVIHKGPETC